MKPRDSETALRANVAAYNSLDERAYINGAPHLKHDSVGRIYRSMVDRAVASLGPGASQATVLELGAGSGLGSTPWFEHRASLTAVDSSEQMLRLLRARGEAFGVKPVTIEADVLAFLADSRQQFDIVTHVSMLHHIPDYLDLLERSAAHVRTGGCLLTFQDPLRYDRMRRLDHAGDRGSYFAWRIFQGNVRRGLKTRWRRLRGIYSPTEVVDFDEYHVVRNGVDSAAIVDLLRPLFTQVECYEYWSTYSSPLQWLGQRLHLKCSFGILALGRQPR